MPGLNDGDACIGIGCRDMAHVDIDYNKTGRDILSGSGIDRQDNQLLSVPKLVVLFVIIANISVPTENHLR